MKVRITTPHINSTGAVAPDSVVDLPDALAIEYIAAKIAVPERSSSDIETATKNPTKETTKK